MSDDLPISPEDVIEITTILEKSDYDTLDIENNRFRLRVSRADEGWTQEWSGTNAAAVNEDSTLAAKEVVAHEEEEGIHLIRSPLPGTFYRAPQPGAPPFIEVGSKVKPDTVIGIIETMKLMNSVHAGAEGEVVDIVAENAEALDADAVLMKVEIK